MASTHNLGKYPSVSVVDTANTAVNGKVIYEDWSTNQPSTSKLQIIFTATFAGKAFKLINIMSIKYLNHINLQGNRIEGAAIEPLGSAPSNNLQTGRVYYDTSDTNQYVLKIYDGNDFVSITGDVTGVANTTTGQLTITNPNGPIPSFAIITGAVSNNGAGLSTQAQIKSYVDAQITAEDLDFSGDSGTGSVDLDSQTFAITGDTGITTTASNQGLSIDLDDTLTVAEAGSYGSSTSIPTFTVNQQGQLTAVGSASVSTTLDIAADSGTDNGVRLGTDTLTISGTANEIETSVSGDTITVGLPNDVSITSQLTVGTASGTDAPVIKSISNSTAENILLESRETSAGSAPDLVLYRNAGTPADSDTLGGFLSLEAGMQWLLLIHQI